MKENQAQRFSENHHMPLQLNSNVTSLKPYPFTKLATLKKKLTDRGLKVFDFSKGDPVEPTPAFIREMLAKSIPQVSQYPAFKGLPELRTAIAGYMTRRFGVSLDPEKHVLQSNGSKEAIYNLTSILIGPGSEKKVVIAPDPGYPVVERSCLMFGAEYYPVGLEAKNGYLLELERIPADVLKRTACVWINYPHNPTGACCSLEYFRRQYEICQKYGILLCSDECYVDMFLDGEPHPSALQVAVDGVVAFHSCSKRSGMTGYRSGFIAGDPEVLRVYLSLRDAIGTETSVMVQHAAAAAWNDDAHAADRQVIFRKKRDRLRVFFEELGLEMAPCHATFYLWVAAPQGISGVEYADVLSEVGIIVTPGEYFGAGCEDRIRIALVPSLAESEEAIQLWRKRHTELYSTAQRTNRPIGDDPK